MRRELAKFSLRVSCVKGTGVSLRYQTNPRFEHLVRSAPLFVVRQACAQRAYSSRFDEPGHCGLPRSGLFTGVLESQIDLLVVGDHLDERVLAIFARSLEAELGREVRYASFETADFRYRLGAYDRLLRDVFDYPHRLLIDKIGL